MKTIIITISVLAATYIGALMCVDIWAGLQEDGWEITSVDNQWSDTPPELNLKASTELDYLCQGLPTGNWYLFVCHIDGSSATCECIPDNELNASWDNEAWFEY